MTFEKIDQVSADIDDASTTVEELRAEPDIDTADKLEELHDALAHASDTLEGINDDKDPGS
jgi:hypothetical protein